VLLISIVLLFTLAPMLENTRTGGLLLLLNLYFTLVAATMQLAERRIIFWSAIPIALTSIVLSAVSHYFPGRPLEFASNLALGAFFSLVSISLFTYLGEKGTITKDRIYASVSLYFLLGLTWFALYSMINVAQPGSFTQSGVLITDETHWSTMLYFSLTTLTTLGYGDIVAVKPTARMIATLEAVAGVLYIAITVARLVAAQSPRSEEKNN
jgi:hypothetical protein